MNRGGGKTKNSAANPPNHHLDNASAAISPAGKGGGEVPEAASPWVRAQVLPGGGFSSRLPRSCFLRLSSESYFQRIPMESLHFPPGFSQGPDRRRGGGWESGCGRLGTRAPGAAATRPPDRAPWRRSLVGRAAPGAEPGLPTPAPRPPRPRLPTPLGEGGAPVDSKDADRGGGTGSHSSPFFTPLG